MNRATFFKHFELLADQPDAVVKMRGLILELAIQGKVAAQNPKDEPASKLLERVSAHSATTDNARAKKSRDEIESLVPAEFWHSVPSSWAVAPLGTVTNIIRGITFPSSAKGRIREKGTVACLRTANVQDEIEWDDLLFIPENYVGRDDQWLKPNDLVISMANSAALVGKVAQAREVPEKASFGGFLAVIRPIELDSTYLLYFLRAPSVQAALRATSSQTTNIANISLGGMRPMPVAVPPLAEQRRIVAKVDELMALCDELEQRQQARQHASGILQQSALHHLTHAKTPADFRRHLDFVIRHSSFDLDDLPQLRQAILQLAVQGRLVPQNPKDEPASVLVKSVCEAKEKLVNGRRRKEVSQSSDDVDADEQFPLPTGWQNVRLGEIADIGTGSTPTSTNPDYYENGIIPWVTSSATSQPFIDSTEVLITQRAVEDFRLRLYAPGTILIALYGQGKTRGQVSQLRIAATVNQACATISLTDGFESLRDYIVLVLREQYLKIREQSAGGAQPNLNGSKVKSIVLSLPPLAEQKRIVARVEELLRWCDTLEAQLHQTRILGAHLIDSTLHHLLAA